MQGFRNNSWHTPVQSLEFGGFPVSAVAPLTGGEAVAGLYLFCAVTTEILGPPGFLI